MQVVLDIDACVAYYRFTFWNSNSTSCYCILKQQCNWLFVYSHMCVFGNEVEVYFLFLLMFGNSNSDEASNGDGGTGPFGDYAHE